MLDLGVRPAVAGGVALVAATLLGQAQLATVAPAKPSARVAGIARWVDAVRQHVPGQRDAALTVVWSVPRAERSDLLDDIDLLLQARLGKLGGRSRSTRDDQSIIDLATRTAQQVDTDEFLMRAAVLHADAAIIDHVAPIPPRGAGPMEPTGYHRRVLPETIGTDQVVTRDGLAVTTLAEGWNWPLARDLMALVKPQTRPFVATWYFATTAYLLRQGSYAEAQAQLDSARSIHDGRLLFERGCLSEILGLPFSQQVVAGNKVARRYMGIPSADKANADAERFFTDAIRQTPSLVEARVRRARLLELRDHDREADAELTIALRSPDLATDPELAYDAHLFAARAERTLGHTANAMKQAQEALALFPGAQSALLASSSAALADADLVDALAPMRHFSVGSSRGAAPADPWLDYRQGPGRNANRLLLAMWKAVPPWALGGLHQ